MTLHVDPQRVPAQPGTIDDEPRRLQTLEALQREIRALSDQGLRDGDFLRALSGAPGLRVRTPEELEAFIKAECEPST